MRNLINFIVKNSYWLVAIILIIFSFYLIFTQNAYQRSIYLTSANSVSGHIYKVADNVSSLFTLRSDNRELIRDNIELRTELENLKKKLGDIESRAQLETLDSQAVLEFSASDASLALSDSLASQFQFIPAEIVNNSFLGVNNSITLNKGTKQGVKADMGVITSKGEVVGIVANCSENFSHVIPIISPLFSLAAKLHNSQTHSFLSWEGDDIFHAKLQGFPKHETYEIGDTVVTGFSRIFPANMIIGYVEGLGESDNDSFNALNVRLSVNFQRLRYVMIVHDTLHGEEQQLENNGQL